MDISVEVGHNNFMLKFLFLILIAFQAQARCNWMQEQIERDLASYANEGLSKEKLYQRFLTIPPELFVIRFVIENHNISTEKYFTDPSLDTRIESFIQAFKDIDAHYGLPDTEFYLLLHDGYGKNSLFADHLDDFPFFVMSRVQFPGQKTQSLFIPDYENLKANYQVLSDQDITHYETKWKKKKNQLIWRGSTAENTWYEHAPYCVRSPEMNENNCMSFSRFCACYLSDQFPSLINARYTNLVGLDETFPQVKKYEGDWLSFEDQFDYKYHILLNGNASPYSASCWKLFTNSVVFIPTSYVFQWYSSQMKPYVHYVPVNGNLSDLVDKLRWAQKHELECQVIAKNCRDFAINNLQREHSLKYIHLLLKSYNDLLF